METILTINNITKNYGSIRAVDELSLEIPRGSIFGILGPNGSGKTTTLGMVLGVLNASSGSYSWFDGLEETAGRKRIGALLETPNFYPYLGAFRNLQIAADIKDVSYNDIERVLKMVNLYDRRNSPFSTFSLGMKQRLALASSLLGNPEALVLDEPTNGLDPQGISEVRELIIRVAAEGKTILLASHLLDEVEKVCSHVAVLKKGKLLAAGKVEEVLAQEDQIEVAAEDMAGLESLLKSHHLVKEVKKANGKFLISANNASANEINAYLFSKGVTVSHLAMKKKSLEAQFLELTSS